MLSERCRYFGFGIMPCWRGPALYDDPASKAAITKWVAFYKKHRAILTSDIIHLRRADHQVRDRYGLSVLYCTWPHTQIVRARSSFPSYVHAVSAQSL